MRSSLKTTRQAPILDDALMTRALRALSRRDPELRIVFKRLGAPPLWSREPGFPTLVHIMLEQQVSLASAKAAFERLRALGPVTPQTFLKLDDDTLRKVGFSRQKTDYVRRLAKAVVDRELDLDNLARMEDDHAKEQLTRLKGIGSWTADIYLLMALRRPDIWPSGDLALAVALKDVKGYVSHPTQAEVEAAAVTWRPWRAVAARLLWLHYLSRPRARRSSSARSEFSESELRSKQERP